MRGLKWAGQVASVALVAALLGLLVWKVVQNDRTNVAASIATGHRTKPVVDRKSVVVRSVQE